MEPALQQTQQTVSSLRALLERPQDPIEVEYRSVPPMRVLAISEPVPMDGIDPWWSAAFTELHDTVHAAGLGRAGPDGTLYSGEFFADGTGDVTAFVPIATGGPGRPGGRVRARVLPGAELAVTVHRGSFTELDRTYGALGTFVSQREIGVPGPIREHYQVTSAHTAHEAQHRTEVCWPVFHIRGEGK